jgi:hypothetical protein
VTITVTVDGVVDQTTAEDIPCTTGSDLAYVLE